MGKGGRRKLGEEEALRERGRLGQGSLTEGENAQYSLPPCTNKFRSSSFIN